MLNVDRVWARQAKNWPPGKKLTDFRLQVVTASYAVGANSSSQNNAVNFGAGAIIIGVDAIGQPTGQAATQQYRPGRDLFTVSISYQADNRVIVGTSEAIASSVFGPFGDLYPALEIPMPQNTALIYNFTNLTSSAITITVSNHCLMPGAVA